MPHSIMMKYYLLLLSFVGLLSCRTPSADAIKTTSIASYHGRVIADSEGGVLLIGPASYIEFTFIRSCTIWMKNIATWNDYNYIVFEVDGVATSHNKVEGRTLRSHSYEIDDDKPHILRIYKATESVNGQVFIKCLEGKGLSRTKPREQKKIEFIGNSITCGAGSDARLVACGSNKWYDQHDARQSYASRLAHALDVEYMLSAVSGIGVYRTWNAEGPSMPEVYEHTYLSKDNSLPWDFSRFTPNIVSIELGTNDLAESKGRPLFDSTTFIKKYVAFINTVYSHYPHTKIALLSSPMVTGAKHDLLLTCLQSVKNTANASNPGKPAIEVFDFPAMQLHGCGGHPTLQEQAFLAEQAEPFFKHLLESTGN